VGGRPKYAGFSECFQQLDTADRKAVSEVYDQLWLSTHFMPQLMRLPLAQVVVVLSNERVYNHQVMESLLTDTRLFVRVDIQFFTQAESAMQWITNNSPRLTLLLAEWQQASGAGSNTVAEPRTRYRAS
jgi:hypothetical protein